MWMQDDDEAAMMRLMGFSDLATTKGKKVCACGWRILLFRSRTIYLLVFFASSLGARQAWPLASDMPVFHVWAA
jgi:hypothetical protein